MKVVVATSGRSDWGLLRPFAEALARRGVDVGVAVTGAHLRPEFGDTVSEVEASGLQIDVRIPILTDRDDALGEAITMGKALEGFAAYFRNIGPDALLILGDRYETLAICEAAFLFRVPVVHLHGGEVTEGALDDSIRHAITKLSSLHLVCAEEYRRRVIQLGEDPSTVFNIGAVGVENALREATLSRSDLSESLGVDLNGRVALFTYHPVTLGDGDTIAELEAVLAPLLEHRDLTVVATKANPDEGGRAINGRLEDLALTTPNLCLFDSLGAQKYLSLMREASVVVGNSSSGILEAPTFKVPTVNVGDRQKGRIRAKNVIDCAASEEGVRAALEKALSDEFRGSLAKMSSPYGNGGTSESGARIIVDALKGGLSTRKKFYDVGEGI